MRSVIYTLSSALVLLSSHALAQAPIPGGPQGEGHFVAKVKGVAGDKLTVVMNDGSTKELVVPAKLKILQSVPAQFSALESAQHSGAVVGCTAAGPAGQLKASECHVFPDSMRGMPGLHAPIPTGTGDTMTMGKITSINGQAQGSGAANTKRTVVISYKDGEQQIEVGPAIPITTAKDITINEIKTGDEVHVGVRTVDGRPSTTVSFLADSTL